VGTVCIGLDAGSAAPVVTLDFEDLQTVNANPVNARKSTRKASQPSHFLVANSSTPHNNSD